MFGFESSKKNRHIKRLLVLVERHRRLLKDAQDKLDALRLALETMKGKSPSRSSASLGVSVEDIANKSIRDAVMHIARENDGELKVSPSRLLLSEAALIKEGQLGSNQFYKCIEEMEVFERVTRGLYRFLDEESNNDQPTKSR